MQLKLPLELVLHVCPTARRELQASTIYEDMPKMSHGCFARGQVGMRAESCTGARGSAELLS